MPVFVAGQQRSKDTIDTLISIDNGIRTLHCDNKNSEDKNKFRHVQMMILMIVIGIITFGYTHFLKK